VQLISIQNGPAGHDGKKRHPGQDEDRDDSMQAEDGKSIHGEPWDRSWYALRPGVMWSNRNERWFGFSYFLLLFESL
jgi:hypothetical protein